MDVLENPNIYREILAAYFRDCDEKADVDGGIDEFNKWLSDRNVHLVGYYGRLFGFDLVFKSEQAFLAFKLKYL